MAKVRVQCGNVAVEGESQKEVFQTLAEYQEVFGISVCGGCGSKNLRFTVRRQADSKGKEHNYYELRCQDCYAKLPYGQHDNGQTLFPKEWVRWDFEKKCEVKIND